MYLTITPPNSRDLPVAVGLPMGRERFDRAPIVWRLHKQRLRSAGIDAEAMDSYASESRKLYEVYKAMGLGAEVYQRLSVGGGGDGTSFGAGSGPGATTTAASSATAATGSDVEEKDVDPLADDVDEKDVDPLADDVEDDGEEEEKDATGPKAALKAIDRERLGV